MSNSPEVIVDQEHDPLRNHDLLIRLVTERSEHFKTHLALMHAQRELAYRKNECTCKAFQYEF